MVWENAPSHICRGGDLRGLAFCCPPVKGCPIHNALKMLKMDIQEFIEIKNDFGKKTKLGKGKNTCFGSLVWCCKISKPCPFRDEALLSSGISREEYMELKKKLSEEILKKSKFFKESVESLEKKGFKREDIEKTLLETGDLKKTIIKLKSNTLKSSTDVNL